MKFMLLIAILLLLLPSGSDAIHRIKGPMPILHSVLDKKQAEVRPGYMRILPAEATEPATYFNDGPRRKQNYGPALRNEAAACQHRQRIATGLLIAGGIVTALGSAMMIATLADFDTGGGSVDGLILIFSGLVLAAGLGMLIPGIVLKSKHAGHTNTHSAPALL